MEREVLLNKQEITNKLPVEVEDISIREGDFTPENGGAPIHWKQYTIGFTIGNNPMIFRAKVDKVFNEYIPDALRGED